MERQALLVPLESTTRAQREGVGIAYTLGGQGKGNRASILWTPRGLGTQNDTSEPKGQELNYSARISLDRTKMQIDDRMVNLSPGMAVTVEIKTGSRMILSYLLSPLLRYRQETLHER